MTVNSAKPWRIQADVTKNSGPRVGMSSHEQHGMADNRVIDSEVDEFVLGTWLHLERMGPRHWWLRLGDADINVFFGNDAEPIVNIFRGEHAKRKGHTRE